MTYTWKGGGSLTLVQREEECLRFILKVNERQPPLLYRFQRYKPLSEEKLGEGIERRYSLYIVHHVTHEWRADSTAVLCYSSCVGNASVQLRSYGRPI